MSGPGLGDLVHHLIGCSWGHEYGLKTPDDPGPCEEKAAQVVVIHDGPREMPFKLCTRHRDRALAETTPRGQNEGAVK